MKNVNINVYAITELPDNIQDRIYQDWLSSNPYIRSKDNEDTLKKFADIFSVQIKDWEYGHLNNIRYKICLDRHIQELKGLRLYKYLINNYWKDIYKPKYIGTIPYHIEHPRLTKLTCDKYEYSIYHSAVLYESNYPLTGYYMDEAILLPVREFLRKPCEDTDFEDLLKDCLESWVCACQKDYEECTSFEYFLQHYQDNDLYFDEHGRCIVIHD